MLLSTCKGVAAAPGQGGTEPAAGGESDDHRGPQSGEERLKGLGVQEWPDGSRYEGEYVNGFKHGRGKYTWKNGEFYEGSFYKDYRHGDGLYCWPTGHKFTGKFYLNRQEGYGQQLFPDGAIFQGLYHADQRFGPGVVSYPDGRMDVGLWLQERLLRLCTSDEEGFSLRNFPEYAAYMDPAAMTDPLTKPSTSGLQTEARTDSEVDTERDLLSDDVFILPPGMESYSTDGDHLPLPPGRRRELDQHFYGELWKPEAYQHKGYERDPLSTLPLQARMQAHIHRHRLQAENVGWDVAAVLSLNREGFGPKGPLEVSSELLIQHASRGDLPAVLQILQTRLVHPDVADSQGHTALIAATVNCNNDVIQLLLDMGADIDKLNCEGMSALAGCHVLYYPFQSLCTTLAEPPAKAQVLRSTSVGGNSPQINQVDFTTDTPRTTEELTEHILHHSCKVSLNSELITERWPGLNEPETPADTKHLQEEERKEKEVEGEERDCKETEREGNVREREERSSREDENENKAEEREIESRCDQTWENEESEVKGKEGELRKSEEDADLGVRRETESRKENMEVSGEDEEDVDKRVWNNREGDMKEREDRGRKDMPGVERFIQVYDGHIALGSVQWKECQAKAAGRVQGKDKELNQNTAFDSACSVSSYNIQVTEEVMQRSAEALSRTGISQRSDTQGTVRKMAAMKTEHRVRLNTLKLLLERGADPNASRIPMLVLFLAILAADSEAVRRLLLCGARTDIPLPPEQKGLYPLHVAAALPGPAGPIITELLLHSVTDPDAKASNQNEIYEPDKIFMKAQEPLSTNGNPNLKEGGQTALHVACQRDGDYRNASKVVALLLSHRASTDHIWSGHSPLSLAIASGNDLAVEELLNGGANPNIPLGRRVGSALCALANVNYHLGGNRAKLLDMLAKAGADILMPVTMGDVVGTAVDYAHCFFNQDFRIANTPFHALNMRERETFKARRQLLSMMGDLLRETACQRENLEREQNHTSNSTSITGEGAISSNVPLPGCESLSTITEKLRKPAFRFCYHCGRSASVKLTVCSRCHKVFYCSRTCKLKAWNERHKEECIQVSASADGIQKSVVFKSPKGPRPLTAMLKSKTVSRPLSIKLKSQRAPKPLSMAEKVLESQVNLKENYSCN
ncbi:ankyrin repeat and MYND domain-containing protein 1 isoform X2 [Etheostoma spectabile]|uniref:ankyrin repeat and MYND domain-containing protein 1 isoform X2 n=1 Tax=Etheostoma spectabile TaxID=54343 RepID=UPI0013AF2ABB|nr:ankyrin repeat and MYND domain-containing protein 1-like isoform X2 [Etheostoma spectabile]